jgi:DNA topoisomerase-1
MLSYKYYFFGGATEKQWSILRHNGPFFPSEYIPHKVPIIFDNQQMILNDKAEEYATMYAKLIGTKYIESTRFKNNFWKDFRVVLNDIRIKSLDSLDFSLIKEHIDIEKEKKKNLSKEEKDKIKEEQLKIEEPYMYCIIDGTQQRVGNYKIEPPGIFLGRGSHPKIGRIKRRIRPEDVMLNLDSSAPIPKPNVDGQWGKIINDQTVIWLASWKDNITDKNKYVFTSMESFFKSKSDEEKFNLARKLKKKINTIRETYELQLSDPDKKKRQLATALYFIDNLALRVGGKKDSKEEADTVGVTSLRVEHITLSESDTIKLDFLGKDSIRYCKKITVSVPVFENLKQFLENKTRKDELFDLINANMLNDYLNSFLDGLTAKVWRTYKASCTFQKELDKLINNKKLLEFSEQDEKLNFLLTIFNQANTEVALLCNHQKNVDTNLDKTILKIDNRIKEYKKKRNKYKENKNTEKYNKINKKIKLLKLKKETKFKMKNVSLTTSKNNYIDPRIIFAFVKKYDIPPEKILTQKLITRFKWASIVDAEYRF